jgi:exodeoxyribonuclease VII large subunit
LHVLSRRWPVAQVRLYPVPVQGADAPAAIRAAIESAGRHRWADLLIIGRGGGSLEDLMAFNDEAVARAVFTAEIPIISAVGHETDFSICDFVADLRAPTPSAAAELATPDQLVLKAAFRRTRRQLQRRIGDRLLRDSQRLDHASHRMQQQHPAARLAEQSRLLEKLQEVFQRTMTRLLTEQFSRLENLSGRLQTQRPDRKLLEWSGRVNKSLRSLDALVRKNIAFRREKLADLARTLNAVSPLETIGRGYAMVTDSESGEIVSSVSQLAAGDRVTTRLKDGTFDSTVTSTRS